MRTVVTLPVAGAGRVRLAVLVSGGGTNLQALLDASSDPAYPAEVVLVVADQSSAQGLMRAERAGVATAVHPLARRPRADLRAESRAWLEEFRDWDVGLAARLREARPDLVVSAGFMRLLGPAVLGSFPGRVLNTHPALLPSFPGTHAVRDALAYGVKVTGATLHLVDSGVDTGPVIEQVAVVVEPGDDEATLHERIKVEERRMLVDTVGRIARHGYDIEGRRVVVK